MAWTESLSFLYNFFTIKDIFEIVLISGAIYYFSRWLRNDHQKNLLIYFYGYCTVILSCYWFELSVAHTFLWITAPIALVLFILFHQETLQKNYVMLRNASSLQEIKDNKEWLEVLIGNCLMASNNNKTIYCIIEHKDSLNQIIEAELPLYADVQKNLLSMLLESEVFDHTKFLWINSHGRLLGINAQWNKKLEEAWLSHQVQSLDAWQQDALFFTAKTDAIIFKLQAQTRAFDIIGHGKIFNNINAPLALKTIAKYLVYDFEKKGNMDDSPKKTYFEQRNS